MTLPGFITKFNRIGAVGVIREDNRERFYLLVVQRRGTKLEIKTTAAFNSFAELAPAVSCPVILIVDGKGVLYKTLDASVENDLEWLRNLDGTRLHYTMVSSSSGRFINVAKKEEIEMLVSEFISAKLELLDFYLGPLTAVLIAPELGLETIQANQSALYFSQGELTGFKREVEVAEILYKWDKSEISNFYLPLYGAIVNYFLDFEQFSKSYSDQINSEELRFKRLFNSLGVGMLASFFIALLASYLTISYLSGKNMELNQQTIYKRQSYQHAAAIEHQVDQKRALLSEMGLFSKRYITSYSYEIAQSVPASIRLDNLEIFPVGEIKPDKKIAIQSGILVVEGVSLSNLDFNSWLDSLKKFQWLKKFEIVAYQKDKKNRGKFEIRIVIK